MSSLALAPLIAAAISGASADEGLELFLEGLLDIHGRLIVSGHVVVMESFEKFRPNAVWITVIILEGWLVVFCGRCMSCSHRRTKVLKGIEKQAVKEDLIRPVQAPARCCRRRWTVRVIPLHFRVKSHAPGAVEGVVADRTCEARKHGVERCQSAQEGRSAAAQRGAEGDRGTVGFLGPVGLAHVCHFEVCARRELKFAPRTRITVK